MNMAISYLMARTLRLPQFRDINMPAATGQVFFEERDASGNRTAGPYGPFPLYLGARPNAIVNRILLTESVGNSNYNGMVLHVNRRFDRGVQFSASFTVAKALDDGQTSTTFFASYPTLFDGANKKAEYGRSNFDVRKRFVTNFLYEPQVMKHLNSAWSKAILGGFKFSGIVILSDGFPVTGTISGSLPSTWGAVNTSSPNGTGGSLRVPYIGRNNFTRPGRATVDFRLAKDFRISESKSVSFFWEAFNLFNHTNYSTVSTTQFAIYSTGTTFDAAAKKGTVALTPDTGFLIPRGASTTTFGPRDMQFAFKFKW
jgi:hypothetical protein